MKKIVLAAAAVAFLPVPAFAQDFGDDYEEVVEPTARDGLRIEARAFWESLSDPEEDQDVVYEFGKAVGFGGEVGYDIAVGDTTVVGPFVTYERSSVESCDGDLCLTAKDFLAVGLHVGSAIGPNSQFYGKLAYTQNTFELTGLFIDPITSEDFVFDESETGSGFQIAGGYEHGFGENLYGRVEITAGENYDLFTFDFQRVSIGVALGARF